MASKKTGPVRLSEPSPGVRLLTLALPKLRNAMTAELTEAWTVAVAEVKADPDVRCVVVTGEGPVFCAGADLSWLGQLDAGDLGPDHLRERMLPFYRAWLTARDLSVPVVAAINGPAIGAGIALALSCDLRYAAPTAVFRASFIQVGTHGGMAANWLLAEAIGLSRAREMLFTGREVGAEEALGWGMVSGVAEDVLDTALGVAERIAAAAPIATRLTKAGINQLPASLDAALQWDALAQPLTMATEDIHEGIRAIHERRPPEFRGRLPGQQDHVVATGGGGCPARPALGGPSAGPPTARRSLIPAVLAHRARGRREPPELVKHIAQCFPAQRVVVVSAVLAHRQQPRLLQDLGVVRNRRLGHG
jgi:enoyl-CoA hydratase/carnithine racemase